MEHVDHRKLGRELGVFTSDEACGPGLPLWLPAGAAIRSEIERYIVELEQRNGYQHVYTPVLAKRQLYERSGHWEHYHDDMFPPMDLGGEELVMRPMNCPHHILVFEHERPALAELPYRIAELAPMFRYERSGVVSGLSRTRQMTLSDGHVFCTEGQLQGELANILQMVNQAYEALAIPQPSFRLSVHDNSPKFIDDDAMWKVAERALRCTLDDLGVAYVEGPGEAAFYGPKIDLQVTDPQGREETLSTIQVDYHHPRRFELDAHRGAEKVRPVMIHRSIVSTMERMVAHVLEVHNGALPPWLSPVQVCLIPIEPLPEGHVASIRDAFAAEGVRVNIDARDATLGARIRAASTAKVPYTAVIGPREAEGGTLALRLRGGEQLAPISLDAAVSLVRSAIAARSRELVSED